MPEPTTPHNPSRVPFDPAWRSNARWKRAFYARYMKWLEVLGFVVVFLIIGGFIFAFNYQVDDVVKADGVEWKFAGTDVAAPEDMYVVRVFVQDFGKVSAGQPLIEYVQGIHPYGDGVPAAKFTRDSIKTIHADASGEFIFGGEHNVVKGSPLYSIVDRSKVVVTATVTGDTVAKAAPGQTARFRDISIGDGPIVVRIESGGHKVISRLLLPEIELPGVSETAVQVAGDKPLQIKEIKSAEVDVKGSWTPEEGTGIVTNPTPNQVVTGEVKSVIPLATVQFADMPEAWRSEFLNQLNAATSSELVRDAQGNTGRVADLSDLRIVLQLKASSESSATSIIPGAKVDRSGEAEVLISNAPPAVLQALMEGKKVTSKLEVITGTRPIAFILLKKS